MSTVTVSKKGWIVIPKEIRERYCIRPGDRMQVVDYGGVIAIVRALKDPVAEALGCLADGPSLTQALLEERAEEKRREEQKIARYSGPASDA